MDMTLACCLLAYEDSAERFIERIQAGQSKRSQAAEQVARMPGTEHLRALSRPTRTLTMPGTPGRGRKLTGGGLLHMLAHVTFTTIPYGQVKN